MKKVISMLIMISLMTGCMSYKTVFPTEINSIANGCKNEAQAKIQSTGKGLKMKSDCYVTERPGAANINGVWCWYDARWKTYIGGLCNGASIQIGCNPNNRADINSPILTHEMAHYWLMTNFKNSKHDPIYDNMFVNWKMSRDVTGSSINKVEFGKSISWTFTNEFGIIVHVDGFSAEK